MDLLTPYIERRKNPASVSMGNKLFAVGGYCNTSCEVFDSFSRKFTLVEADLSKFIYSWPFNIKAVCIGSTILVIIENYVSLKKDITIPTMCIYDVKNNQWSKKRCSVLKSLTNMAFVKYYTD